MDKIQNIFNVVSNKKLCPRFYRLCINTGSLLKKVNPGQFVHIRLSGGYEPFFRRPFSVSRVKKYLEIIYEVVGPGTGLLSKMKRGDDIDVLGPVGSCFTLPVPAIKQVVMIAGGIGIAPFLAFSDVLKKKNLSLVLLYGGRTKGHVYPMQAFKKNGCQVFVSTDDGSAGVKGRVSKLFPEIDLNPTTTMIYTCGPNPMMASVQRFARKYQLKAEAACEAVMACALGACLGCSIKTIRGYKTCCYDGPVFDLREVIFS